MKTETNTNAQQRMAMEVTNRRQQAYYDETDGGSVSAVNSIPTNLWRVLRKRAQVTISNAVRSMPYDKHREWLGDLSDKKVLDLGCGNGTRMTRYLANAAGTYHAIDLAEAQVGEVRKLYGDKANAKFFVGDFLQGDTTDTGYDVIYAHSVVHHFRYLEPLFDRLEQVLAPGGVIVTLDPSQSWWPARAFRAMFRPFQTDAEWEFPFTNAAMDKIESRFDVIDRAGVFGRAKWAWVLGMISPSLGKRFGDTWFRQDFEQDYQRSRFRRCLVVSYHLRARQGGLA